MVLKSTKSWSNYRHCLGEERVSSIHWALNFWFIVLNF